MEMERSKERREENSQGVCAQSVECMLGVAGRQGECVGAKQVTVATSTSLCGFVIEKQCSHFGAEMRELLLSSTLCRSRSRRAAQLAKR